jgi:hypothetical protein
MLSPIYAHHHLRHLQQAVVLASKHLVLVIAPRYNRYSDCATEYTGSYAKQKCKDETA